MLFIALSDKQEGLEEHTCRFQMCRNIAFMIQGTLFPTFLQNNVQAAARKKCNFELYIHQAFQKIQSELLHSDTRIKPFVAPGL